MPLGEVADWRCVAPTGEGGEACGHRHRHRAALTRGGWHLWQVRRRVELGLLYAAPECQHWLGANL